MAGFFDGEGCIGIKKTYTRKGADVSKRWVKTHNHSPYITISQVRPAVLHLIQDLFGGSIYFNKGVAGANGIWCWQRGGSKSVLAFVRAVRPYVIVKAEECDIVAAAFDEMVRVKKAGTPQSVVDKREEARIALAKAKVSWRR